MREPLTNVEKHGGGHDREVRYGAGGCAHGRDERTGEMSAEPRGWLEGD